MQIRERRPLLCRIGYLLICSIRSCGLNAVLKNVRYRRHRRCAALSRSVRVDCQIRLQFENYGMDNAIEEKIVLQAR